jgi:hypothetical protein
MDRRRRGAPRARRRSKGKRQARREARQNVARVVLILEMTRGIEEEAETAGEGEGSR